MNKQLVSVVLIGIGSLLAMLGTALAQDGGSDAQCVVCADDSGTGNYIDLGAASSQVDGDEISNEQRGLYPTDTWFAGARLHFPDEGWKKDRFELRLDDVWDENGRAWGRLALWPVTLEFDGYLLGSYAWNMYDGLALQEQQVAADDLKLRIHRGELDNGVLRYQAMEFDRQGDVPLYTNRLERFSYAHNFNWNEGRLTGSFQQTSTAIDAPGFGVYGGEVDNSAVRLTAKLSDKFGIYGRGSVTKIGYDNLPDSSVQGTDYTLGISYKPTDDWVFKADFGSTDRPADNAVSSHVDGVDSYGFQLAYAADCENRIEAGYRHKSVDYVQLHMQDLPTWIALHTASAITPADVAASAELITPDINEMWVSGRWALGDKLTADARLSYTDGNAPGTDIVAQGSPSLYYDQRLDRTLNLNYDVNGNDQLAFMYTLNESSNQARGSDYDLRYLQGSWSRCIGEGGNVALVVSNANGKLSGDAVSNAFTTNETTYAFNYGKELSQFDYALDFSYTAGSGVDEYTQQAIGADLALKCWGPLSFRVNWFDRNYDTHPDFDTQATEYSVRYRIDL